MKSVHVPRLLHYDSDNHVLVMEHAGDLPTLKSWLRADTPPNQITSVGQILGSYLAHIHNTTANDSSLKAAFSSNTIAKNVSSSVYFAALPAAAEKYGYTQPFIAAAAQYAAEQVLTANEVWTLGDFWTGNVLVSAPEGQDEPEVTVLDLELAKPGTAAFDIGHMGAEMLCLAHFRHQDQGFLLLQSFLRAYRSNSKVSVDAAAVAIRM
jgi:aminoglycoside phosphotransferase (APT) family kinase protein